MFTLRTHTDVTARHVRRLLRHGYEILAIETDHQAERDHNKIIWIRNTAHVIPDHELPF